MTSALKTFDILRKENKRNSMSPEQEQNTELAYIVEKPKEGKLKLAKNFKTSTPGKGKVKEKGKERAIEKKSNSLSMGREKKIGISKIPRTKKSTKNVNNKKYHLCPTHQYWTIHRLDE